MGVSIYRVNTAMLKGPKYQRGIIGMAAAGTMSGAKTLAFADPPAPPGIAPTLLFNFEPIPGTGGSPVYGSPVGWYEEVEGWPAQFQNEGRLITDQVKFGTHSYRGYGNNVSTGFATADGIHFPKTLVTGSPQINPALSFGTQDWTMEGWVRLDSLPSTNVDGYALLSKYNRTFSDTDWLLWFGGDDTFRFTWSDNGLTTGLSTTSVVVSITTGQWYHWAVQRRGGDLELLFEGQLRTRNVGEFGATSMVNQDHSPLAIANLYQAAVTTRKRALDGWMDSTRIVIGQTVYDINGSPPTLTGSPETYTIPTAAFTNG